MYLYNLISLQIFTIVIKREGEIFEIEHIYVYIFLKILMKMAC